MSKRGFILTTSIGEASVHKTLREAVDHAASDPGRRFRNDSCRDRVRTALEGGHHVGASLVFQTMSGDLAVINTIVPADLFV